MGRIFRQLSPSLTASAGVLLAAGLAVGLADYLTRSTVPVRFVPGSSAWWQQGAVAVTGIVILAVARWRRRTPRGRLWLLAPLGRTAGRRVAATLRGGGGRRAAPGRAALALLPAALFLYGPFRAGRQITSGLDPNATVNAWGGPGYAGALACHWLDLILLMAVAARLLDKILVPDPAGPSSRRRRHRAADDVSELASAAASGTARRSTSQQAPSQDRHPLAAFDRIQQVGEVP